LAGFEPPLDFERLQLFDPKRAPFFRHGEACYWLATDARGRAIGRISAQFDRLTPPERGHIGHFGCLDTIDDAAVVAALLAKARVWHAERGRTRIEGPFNLSINEEAGLQISGQSCGAMFLMTWHPAYLAAHVEAAGLVAIKDLLAYAVSSELAGKWRGMASAKPSTQSGYTSRKLDVFRLDREAGLMADMFNASWKDNWGFVPLVRSELTTLLRSIWPILRPSHAAILMVDGKPAAFAFALPNLTQLYRGLGGRLLPFNWLKLISRVFFHRFTSCRCILLGVRPDLHNSIVGARLSAAAVALIFNQRPSEGEIEMSWILEDNLRILRIIELLGSKVSKVYRVYGDPLPEALAA
jgi:hypothetical protein